MIVTVPLIHQLEILLGQRRPTAEAALGNRNIIVSNGFSVSWKSWSIKKH
jgi:hypothetical protein